MDLMKLFKDGETIATMKNLSTTAGVEIGDYVTGAINKEELYTSINTLSFRYAEGLPYLQDLKRDNFIRAYSNGKYNLYVINEVEYDTDDGYLDVHCEHYTTLFAGEAVPNLTLYKGELTMQDVINGLNNSPYKSPDYNIRLSSDTPNTEPVDLTGYAFGNTTTGQLWTGSSSFFRKHFGTLIIRDLQGITIINPDHYNLQQYPLTLGVNIKGLHYTLEEPERYSHTMVNLASIPRIEVQGTGLVDTKKVHSGLANTNLTHFNQLDEGDELQVFYKGLLICIRKTGGQLTTHPYSLPRLTHTPESLGIDPLFHQNNTTAFNGSRFFIQLGDSGNKTTLLDETIDPTYLIGYRAYINAQNVRTDPDGQLGTQKYLGFTPKKSNGVGDEGLDVLFYQIDNELFKVPVSNHLYNGRARNVYLIDYPEPDPDKIRTRDKTYGFSEAQLFYEWFFNGYKGFWYSEEAQKLNQPKFRAEIEIDAMESIFGVEYISNHEFRLGDKYNVNAAKQGLSFESELTAITYNITEMELISVEFGTYQDFEAEEVRNTAQSSQARKIYDSERKTSNKTGTDTKQRTNTKPVITLADTVLDPSGGNNRELFINNLVSALDKEDGDITHLVIINYNNDETEATYTVTDSDGKTDTKKARILASGGSVDEEWLGEWMNEVLNGKDIRTDEELFNGDLPYKTRTDDTGIPKMEWEPPYVTISKDGNESTPTTLICYNGAEKVISEVKFKGDTGEVRVDHTGRFRLEESKLPSNVGFPIVPYPSPGTTGTKTLPLVYALGGGELFNQDTTNQTVWFEPARGTTQEDIDTMKEHLGYKYSISLNATTKGTIMFETDFLETERQIKELSTDLNGVTFNGLYNSYQVKDLKEFKDTLKGILIGKTVTVSGYNTNYPQEDQTLSHYLIDTDGKYLKSVYKNFLNGISGKIARASVSPAMVKDILTINFELTGVKHGSSSVKKITGFELDETALEAQILRDGPARKESEGAWQRLIFTTPTTKVNGQTVKLNHLLITNGGVSLKKAIISKQTVDALWEQLTKQERKEFEDKYGKEWLFDLKHTTNQYTSDDILYGSFYRTYNKIEPPGAIDPFGIRANAIKKDEERARRIAERYQQKYNYAISKGLTVPPSPSGETLYNDVEKYYQLSEGGQ